MSQVSLNQNPQMISKRSFPTRLRKSCSRRRLKQDHSRNNPSLQGYSHCSNCHQNHCSFLPIPFCLLLSSNIRSRCCRCMSRELRQTGRSTALQSTIHCQRHQHQVPGMKLMLLLCMCRSSPGLLESKCTYCLNKRKPHYCNGNRRICYLCRLLPYCTHSRSCMYQGRCSSQSSMSHLKLGNACRWMGLLRRWMNASWKMSNGSGGT